MKKRIKFLFWAPRILAILFIAFLAMFSLDVFDSTSTFWEIAGGLFMHNIPSLILLVLLIISWKHELVGAIAFIFVGMFFLLRSLLAGIINPPFRFELSVLIIAGPAFLVGILFLVGWLKKKKKN
ncbi:hypothetical protein M0R19_02705 [Candidatus Pacearchaeota archaeon]|jgi:hypothetical protein|nr:hypothetical protein [Candidatus Pacearchaeota archaeon]